MPRVTITETYMFLRYMLFYFYLEFVNFLYLKPRLSRIVRIVLSSDAITSTAIVVVHTMKYISLMPELNNADALEDNVLRNFGGAVENNLNHVLGNLSDTSEDLAIFTHSSYIDTSQLEDKLTEHLKISLLCSA